MARKTASANIATEKQAISVEAYDEENIPAGNVVIIFDDTLSPRQLMVLMDRIRDRINELDGK